MKPVLYIIGLGYSGLGKLSLECYRRLKAANIIFTLALDHEAIKEIIAEGLPCFRLNLPEGANGQDIAKAILAWLDHNLSEQVQQAVLALPGYPLAEGRKISTLGEALSAYLQLDTSLLPEDNSIQKLETIMAELRSVQGCPWDREQNHQTLKRYLIEETYEVIDAIEAQDMNNFCEELGDLLLQIVFHARIAQESGDFELADVIRGICQKMIRRHPHVFGSVEAKTSEAVLVNWDKIKKKEKASAWSEPNSGSFFDIPKGLPALLMAEKTQNKVAKMGFDWDSYQGPLNKVYEELKELEKEIGNPHKVEEELGDLLFSIVNLSRFLNLNAEDVLRRGTKKFQARFNQMLSLIKREGLDIKKMDLKEMDHFWDLTKEEEKNGMDGPFY